MLAAGAGALTLGAAVVARYRSSGDTGSEEANPSTTDDDVRT